MRHTQLLAFAATVLAIGLSSTESFAQRGKGAPQGRGGSGFRGGQGDSRFAVDREVFHFLLANGDKIHREVTNLKDGVETVTESDDPEVAGMIQEHVAAMYVRVETPSPIRMRDPLFAEIFRHTDKIEMKVEETKKGVKAIEASKDPYVAKLIQEHAKVVSLFVKNGFDEAHKNHAVPGKPLSAAGADAGITCQEGKCCKDKLCCHTDKQCARCKHSLTSTTESNGGDN